MALIEYLNQQNMQVLAVVRGNSRRKAQIRENDKTVLVECALTDMNELPFKVKEAVERRHWDTAVKVDTFYHFAWEGTGGNSRDDL